jgi:hypothetical protein
VENNLERRALMAGKGLKGIFMDGGWLFEWRRSKN